MPGVTLPPLRQHPSPNVSSRRGVVPWLIVVHRPAGSFAGSERTLVDPNRRGPNGEDLRVSAHVLTDSNREAVQLVPWDRKAWAAKTFNSPGYHVEVCDDAWRTRPGSLQVADEPGFATAARIVAFLCKRTGIPPVWSQLHPHDVPGVTRHLDLGRAGGGHKDPTEDVMLWRWFMHTVRDEYDRGGFRPTWGVGELHRIDT